MAEVERVFVYISNYPLHYQIRPGTYREAVLKILTEIDFFPQLEDSIEDCLEGTVILYDWDLEANYSYSKSSYSDAMFNQCKGIAKSTGKRCKIRTENESGYCQYHGWQGE